MNAKFLSESDKAAIAGLQTIVRPVEKAELEFALNDYQDLVSQIMKKCEAMGLGPAEAISGYMAAVASCVVCFTAEPKEGMERQAADTTGEILAEYIFQMLKGKHP